MNRDEIKAIIPHREPMLLLDEVDELTAGQTAHGWLQVTDDMFWCQGHFPGNAVMPGVLQVEALAQLGAVIVLSLPEFQGRTAYFGGIKAARFRRMVRPGDRLELAVEIKRILGPAGFGTGKAFVEGEPACDCDLQFVIGD